MNKLRKAAEAVRVVWSEGASADSPEFAEAMLGLENALAEPDELAEAREIIALITQEGLSIRHMARASEFLKRTEP